MKILFSTLIVFVSAFSFAAPVVSGKLVIAKDLAPKARGIRTVFVSLYDAAGTSTAMPCAAQKLELAKDASGEFLSYTLDDTSLTLMGCSAVPEQMNIKVKLDKDGSAGPDADGDLVGVMNGIKKGSTGVKVLIDRLGSRP